MYIIILKTVDHVYKKNFVSKSRVCNSTNNNSNKILWLLCTCSVYILTMMQVSNHYFENCRRCGDIEQYTDWPTNYKTICPPPHCGGGGWVWWWYHVSFITGASNWYWARPAFLVASNGIGGMFLCPQLRRSWRGILLLGRLCVRASIRPCVRPLHFLVHSITSEPCMLGFWNFIYGFFMKK